MANEFGSYKGTTYANGQLPKKWLKPLEGDNDALADDPAVLREDAADAWNAAREAVFEKTGIVLTVRGWYRLRAQQEKFFLQRYKKGARSPFSPPDYRKYKGSTYGRVIGAPAAIPGTSNHGLGTTVDVNDFGAYNTDGNARRAATIGILREYGWSTTEGDSIKEPWHLNYVPALNKHKGEKPAESTKEEGYLMGLSLRDQKAALWNGREAVSMLKELKSILGAKIKDGDGAATPREIWERDLAASRATLTELRAQGAANRAAIEALVAAVGKGLDPQAVLNIVDRNTKMALDAVFEDGLSFTLDNNTKEK